MSNISERVYDVGHDHDPDQVMHVTVDDGGKLALIVIDDEATATLKIDREGAKKLRLILQRYERSH